MNKQQTIINTALSLFSKYGYHSIGVDRIRDEAKVSKMTMYKYFPSKEILIENVLMSRDKDFRQQWQQTINDKNSYIEKLKALFDWHQQWFQQKNFYGCLFIKANEEFPEHPSIQQLVQKHKQYLQKLIEDILIEGKIDQAVNLAAHITTILEGLIISNNIFKQQQTIESHWQYIKNLITIVQEQR
ncbi:TetR/AcrR family transcriptional regulator [Entomomonas asaccharolytica]|uniref:TetR/AcrR family transcriptional regulator n=1 Tax=Entomomonas asaccharolytica TaxID=2785331 RepID=A0A974NGZ0_9GAMM|nr:TetR/AcrR family transcriptional regulator [Entomomonas asaccharolytica]QQP86378.1 TetR/AcrR family transcriptional regulator [Entomomonas asaccharolytica]